MQKTRNLYHYMISYESKLCVMQNICLTRPVAATHSRRRAPHRTLAAVAAATVAAAAAPVAAAVFV